METPVGPQGLWVSGVSGKGLRRARQRGFRTWGYLIGVLIIRESYYFGGLYSRSLSFVSPICGQTLNPKPYNPEP